MTPIRYTAKVLPDGHLPLPKECCAKVGEEVEVTVAVRAAETDDEVGKRQQEEGLKLAGIIRSGKSDISIRHDDYLYGKPGA